MRGEQGPGGPGQLTVKGSTPVCVGTAPRPARRGRCRRQTPVWDHPRVRGEQPVQVPHAVFALGSPPRARGTARAAGSGSAEHGITPACTGNSARTPAPTSRSRDHPRVRGEQDGRKGLQLPEAGSPPRARGTVRHSGPRAPVAGITPACAGNSSALWPARTRSRDHPRVRGEQRYEPVSASISFGSPPRARGTDAGGGHGIDRARITPACAGNRWSGSTTTCRHSDHPRVRGEQLRRRRRLGRLGSPPRARGTDTYRLWRIVSPGITPACAGNSFGYADGDRDAEDHPRVRGEQTVDRTG